MKNLNVVLLVVFLTLGITLTAPAAPVDLTSWSQLTLDFPGGQSAGNWVLEPGNDAVTQVVNADPSLYLNNLNQTNYSMDGSWQVLTGGDDDYMGFVFGYQNSSNFYLFDWKQGSQGYSGGTANEGMTIKKMTGASGDGLTDLSLGELWENGVALGDMEVLATNHSSSAGWADFELYNFHLDFNLTPGTFKINVTDSSNNVLWDVAVNDTTFTIGQFGFYNYSQGSVRYAGFEQTEGTLIDDDPGPNPIPEPATMLLFGTGLAGLAGLRLKRKKK